MHCEITPVFLKMSWGFSVMSGNLWTPFSKPYEHGNNLTRQPSKIQKYDSQEVNRCVFQESTSFLSGQNEFLIHLWQLKSVTHDSVQRSSQSSDYSPSSIPDRNAEINTLNLDSPTVHNIAQHELVISIHFYFRGTLSEGAVPILIWPVFQNCSFIYLDVKFLKCYINMIKLVVATNGR